MPVRRALAAVLALPVLASIYLSLALRRGPATRVALATGIGGLVIVAAIGFPAGTVGAPQATQAPLAASALGPAITVSRSLTSALLVDFDAPMDPASVDAAVEVEPKADVTLSWSGDGRRLSVTPTGAWSPSTLYTVTVGTGARDEAGRMLGAPLRAGFLTRGLTRARLAVTDRLKSGVALDSSVVISFDRPVAVASVLRSFRISPAVPGQLLVATDGADVVDPSVADNFVWEPDGSFEGRTSYTVDLAPGILDEEGSPIVAPEPLAFKTTASPSVVRFRPLAGTEDVARDAPVSVRFTEPMGHASTVAAFSVLVNGKKAAGTVVFAEDNKVLVFDPASDFPYGATVSLRVAGSAKDVNGNALDRARSAEFTVVAKPKPKPQAAPKPAATTSTKPKSAPKPAPKPTTKPKPTPKPAPAARPSSSSWLAAEKYLLTLLNCTRGGGWVLTDGSCSSPGGSGIAPLKYHAGISDRVARPYAKKLATAGVCSHFYGGDPSSRLRAAGYTGYQWGENIGCRYFRDPRDAAVSLVRFFQSEKSWSPPGGHWVNMMNRKFTHAGIGLWVSGGNLNFVINFYTP